MAAMVWDTGIAAMRGSPAVYAAARTRSLMLKGECLPNGAVAGLRGQQAMHTLRHPGDPAGAPQLVQVALQR